MEQHNVVVSPASDPTTTGLVQVQTLPGPPMSVLEHTAQCWFIPGNRFKGKLNYEHYNHFKNRLQQTKACHVVKKLVENPSNNQDHDLKLHGNTRTKTNSLCKFCGMSDLISTLYVTNSNSQKIEKNGKVPQYLE